MIVEIDAKNEIFRCRTDTKYDSVKTFIKYILNKKKVKSAKINIATDANRSVLKGKLTSKDLSNGTRYYVDGKGLAFLYPNIIREQKNGR